MFGLPRRKEVKAEVKVEVETQITTLTA